jgi:phenylalanine ammonia-lyase
MNAIAESCTTPLVNFFLLSSSEDTSSIQCIPAFRKALSARAVELSNSVTAGFLTGERGSAPASKYLKRTRAVYEYVRNTLGVKMHGKENFEMFNHLGIDGVYGMPGGDDGTVGENITRIYEVPYSICSVFLCQVVDTNSF